MKINNGKEGKKKIERKHVETLTVVSMWNHVFFLTVFPKQGVYFYKEKIHV